MEGVRRGGQGLTLHIRDQKKLSKSLNEVKYGKEELFPNFMLLIISNVKQKCTHTYVYFITNSAFFISLMRPRCSPLGAHISSLMFDLGLFNLPYQIPAF